MYLFVKLCEHDNEDIKSVIQAGRQDSVKSALLMHVRDIV